MDQGAKAYSGAVREADSQARGVFSFMEISITIVIVIVLGGVAAAALWVSFSMFAQAEDYANFNAEIGSALQKLGREFSLVGLGMPNNVKSAGDFASAFAYPANPPIMASMGSADAPWGGPVTVGNENLSNGYDRTMMVTRTTSVPGGDMYIVPELYYAWGVPTGVKALFPSPDPVGRQGDTVTVT